MWELSGHWYELIIRATIVFLGLFVMFKIWGRKHLGEMAAFNFVLLIRYKKTTNTEKDRQLRRL